MIHLSSLVHQILAAADYAVFLLQDGQIIDCGGRTSELFGLSSSDELQGLHLWALSPATQPDGADSQTIVDKHLAAVWQNSPVRYFFTLRRPNGALFDAYVTLSKLPIDDHATIICYVRDATEQKLLERKLREGVEHYRQLVELQSDLVVKLDAQGRLLYVSPSYCRLFDKPEEEMLGNTFVPLTDHDAASGHIGPMTRLKRPPHTCYLDQRADTRIGTRWLAWMMTSVFDNTDNLSTIIGVGRDITERLRASEEIRERLEFETLVAEMSSKLVDMPHQKTDRECERWMQRIAEFMHMDIAQFWFPDEIGGTLLPALVWQRPGFRIERTNADQHWPWTKAQLLAGKDVCYESGVDFPPEASTDRESYEREGWSSAVSIPVQSSGKVVGVFTVAARQRKGVSPAEIQRLRLAAEVLANAQARKRSQEEIERRLEVETMLADMAARFVTIDVRDFDTELTLWMKRIATLLEADRFVIWKPVPESAVFVPLRSWVAPGTLAIIPGSSVRYPWLTTKIIQGKSVVMDRLDDLPPEADSDRIELHRNGLRSFLLIPMMVDGKTWGVVSISRSEETRNWPRRVSGWLNIVAEIIGNAMHRKSVNEELHAAFSEINRLKEQLEAENVMLRYEIQTSRLNSGLIGRSTVMQKVTEEAEQVAPTDSTVLILGETGTGKELLARSIHNSSSRSEGPLVIVNCATIPSTLFESELFGHERGAFTGAACRKIGRFEMADGGTLFLDEIGELPLDIQAKLLRALQSGEFERLGGTASLRVNVRVLAATNRSLAQAVRDGEFRGDLFYRINVFPIEMPPLRERTEDIPELVAAFIEEFGERMGKRVDSIPVTAIDALRQYRWPGNVRELRNVIERAMIQSTGTSLKVSPPKSVSPLPLWGRTIEEVERLHITRVLSSTEWRVRGDGGAAEILGMKPTTLESRMKKLQIMRPR